MDQQSLQLIISTCIDVLFMPKLGHVHFLCSPDYEGTSYIGLASLRSYLIFKFVYLQFFLLSRISQSFLLLGTLEH